MMRFVMIPVIGLYKNQGLEVVVHQVVLIMVPRVKPVRAKEQKHLAVNQKDGKSKGW